MVLIALATVLSLYGAGLEGWALLNMTQTAYAFTTFVTVYALLWSRREFVPIFATALAVGIVVVVVALIVTYEPGLRPSGTLYHPNYAGHYLVAAAFGVWTGLPWRLPRYAVVAVAFVGVLLTASFGALLMIVTGAGYLLLCGLRTRPWIVAYLVSALLLLQGVGSAFLPSTVDDTARISSTLSGDRLERSGSGRLYIWTQALQAARHNPLGVGPDGLHNRGFITRFREAHNLYVAFLAERGFLGLIALLALGAALWRHAPPGGVARALILAFAASNMFRETLHYRHMWIVLALALVVDHRTRLEALARTRLDVSRQSLARLNP